jgi:hypothetical protein
MGRKFLHKQRNQQLRSGSGKKMHHAKRRGGLASLILHKPGVKNLDACPFCGGVVRVYSYLDYGLYCSKCLTRFEA